MPFQVPKLTARGSGHQRDTAIAPVYSRPKGLHVTHQRVSSKQTRVLPQRHYRKLLRTFTSRFPALMYTKGLDFKHPHTHMGNEGAALPHHHGKLIPGGEKLVIGINGLRVSKFVWYICSIRISLCVSRGGVLEKYLKR